MSELKDSGARVSYGEGKAVRDVTTDKGRFDLICMQMLYRQAKHMEGGAKKYDSRNWEQGMDVSRCIDAAMRHLTQYIMGWNDEPHLDAAIWNLAAITYYEYKMPELMDLPERKDIPLHELQKYCVFPPDENEAVDG
jgi:hypothetical protein